jgi:hypothetical protein
VVHFCNPSYSGGFEVRGWPGQKHETLSKKQAKKSRKDQGHGSSSRVLALRVPR